MRALVTGGAGFLGSHLCRRLLAEGYEVTALDNLLTGSDANLSPFAEDSRFRFVRADVTSPLDGDYDEIYNLACPASPIHYQFDPVATVKTNVLGALNVLELARKTGAKVFHASTSEVYGDPLVHPQVESYWGNVNPNGLRSCYDEGKRCAETIFADYRRQYGVDVRLVRIFNTYGPNMHPNDGRVVSNFIVQALANEEITVFGSGEQTRSFQYCDDLIEAIRRLMRLERGVLDTFVGEHSLGLPVINVGNPGEYTMKELAELTLALIPESASKIVYRPLPADDPKKRRPDIALARELLGWSPVVPLAEGLKRTIEYFRNLNTTTKEN